MNRFKSFASGKSLLPLFIGVSLLVGGAVSTSLTGCGTPADRVLLVASQVNQTTVSNAVVAWSHDFVRRAEPYVFTNAAGRREIDYSKAPHLLAEKQQVDTAVERWRSESKDIIKSLRAWKELSGTNALTAAESERYRADISSAATNVIHLIKQLHDH